MRRGFPPSRAESPADPAPSAPAFFPNYRGRLAPVATGTGMGRRTVPRTASRRRGMSAFSHLLAVALLTAPSETPKPAETVAPFSPVMQGLEMPWRLPDLFMDQVWHLTAPYIQRLAVRWEILDPREVKYVLM